MDRLDRNGFWRYTGAMPMPILHLLEAGSEARAEGLLTPAEQETLASYRFAKRRRDWLLGRLAAKEALARAAGWAPRAVAIARGEKGRPVFTGPDAALAGWEVSITHGHGRAAAVAAPGPVGVDLELARAVPENGWRFFLSERERAWLAAEPLGEQGEIVVWALKEAVYKALHGAVSGVLGLEVVEAGAGVARVATPDGAFEGRWARVGEFVLAVAGPEGAPWLGELASRLTVLSGCGCG